MKKLRWQILLMVLALVAIAAILLSQQQTPDLEAIVVDEPVSGGVYSEALIGKFRRLNPTLDFFNPPDRDVNRLIFSSLLKFDSQGLPQPDLAESWGISRDGQVYNIALRPQATWHDGANVSSDDVVFTIELLRDPNYPAPEDVRSLWESVEVRRLDELNLQFRLAEPFAPFLDYLTFGVLPSHLLGELSAEEIINDGFNLNPVGSGPYAFDQLLVQGDEIKGVVLKAYEEYSLGRAFIDQVLFLYYPDAPAALAAYQNGEVLGISRITEDILAQALAEPTLSLYTGRLPELTMVYFNLGDAELPFFQNVNVRKALLTGLNRQALIDRTLNGQAILASGPILPGSWAYFSGVGVAEFNRQAAIEMLRKAGYAAGAGGERLSFELAHPDDERHTAVAQAIQQDWQELGVQVTLKPVSYETLLDEYLIPRTYQAVLVDINLANSPDPDPYPFWHQTQITGGQNYAMWDDRQASEYLEQARVTVDLTERKRLYNNFQVRFAEELPALPLYYPVYTYGVNETIQGVSIGPLYDSADRFYAAAKWYLKTERVLE